MEVISAKVTKEQITLIKNLILHYKDKRKAAKITNPKFGQIGDEILMSLKVDPENYKNFLKILVENNFNILFTKNTPAGTRQIVQELKDKKEDDDLKIRMKEAENVGSVSQRKVNADKSITVASVEQLLKKGDYEELFRISRSINCSPAVVEKAQQSLGDAVQNKIQELHSDGLINPKEGEVYIKKLIKIATDKNLRIAKDLSFMKDAGKAAIDIAAQTTDTVSELISICNNNGIHHTVTIEAAAKFSEIIFADPESFADEFEMAVRGISTRWLAIAYDIAAPDLDDNQKEDYNKLVDYINDHR